MAAKDKGARRSRRARRREQTESEGPAASEESQRPSDEEDEAPEEEAEAEEPEDEEAAAAARRADRPARRGRRKKRARREDDEDSEGERIRDRNRRIREQAAAARRSRRKEQQAAVTAGLDAGEMVDDALVRTTHVAFQWIKRHFNAIQWVLVIGIASGVGWQIYAWRSARSLEDSSDDLMEALSAERGRVIEPESPSPPAGDLRQQFPTEKERLTAAAEGYEKAASGSSGSGTTVLGKLGLAGILFDRGKYAEALTAYEEIRGTDLAQSDPDVQGRAIEGIGLCLEAKKDPEGALRTFRELENTDTAGFVSLARYHQARILYAKGEKDKAMELLKKVRKKLAKARSANQPPGYLELAALDLQHTIDPSLAETPTTSLSPDELTKLRQQMQKLQEQLAKQKGSLSQQDVEQLVKDPSKLQKLLEDLGKLPGKLAPSPSQSGAPSPAPAPQPASSQ